MHSGMAVIVQAHIADMIVDTAADTVVDTAEIIIAAITVTIGRTTAITGHITAGGITATITDLTIVHMCDITMSSRTHTTAFT